MKIRLFPTGLLLVPLAHVVFGSTIVGIPRSALEVDLRLAVGRSGAPFYLTLRPIYQVSAST